MMCQRIGRPPISTIGFGRISVSSAKRVPRPPQRIMACTRVIVRTRSGLDDARARDRDDESTAARSIDLLLPEDLVCEVPREQKRVPNVGCDKTLRRLDRDVRPRCEEAVFELASVDDEVEH